MAVRSHKTLNTKTHTQNFMDKLTITILEDGTIKTDSDGISAPNHSNAESFLREVIRLAGGTVKRTLKLGASLAHALHHHSQDGHTH